MPYTATPRSARRLSISCSARQVGHQVAQTLTSAGSPGTKSAVPRVRSGCSSDGGAGWAPGGPEVDRPGLAREEGGGAEGALRLLQRRQREVGQRLADHGGADVARVEEQALVEEAGDHQEQRQGNQQKCASHA